MTRGLLEGIERQRGVRDGPPFVVPCLARGDFGHAR
jgi:hypothetical protein